MRLSGAGRRLPASACTFLFRRMEKHAQQTQPVNMSGKKIAATMARVSFNGVWTQDAGSVGKSGGQGTCAAARVFGVASGLFEGAHSIAMALAVTVKKEHDDLVLE